MSVTEDAFLATSCQNADVTVRHRPPSWNRPHWQVYQLLARSADNWIQSVCPGVQMSTSGSTNIPRYQIFHFHRRFWYGKWIFHLRLFYWTSLERMDACVIFRNNKRVNLREDDLTAGKISHIFQVRLNSNVYGWTFIIFNQPLLLTHKASSVPSY